MAQWVALCVLLAVALASSARGAMIMSGVEKADNTLALTIMEESTSVADPTIPALAGKLGLTELVSLVVKADLVKTLSGRGPFTLFGPTNAAIANLPPAVKEFIKKKANLAQVLRYHVVDGRFPYANLKDEILLPTDSGKEFRMNLYPKGKPFKVATVQCSPIDLSRIDEKASNGFIHVLNRVMIPPSGALSESFAAMPNFKTLTTALKVAGVYTALNSPGPYTLFAPTDDAFSKLPPGVLDKLFKDTVALAAVLEYHAVMQTYCSVGLSSGTFTTFSRKTVKIDVSSGGVTVNGIKVTKTDISVTNGVGHVIEGVLIPPGMNLTAA